MYYVENIKLKVFYVLHCLGTNKMFYLISYLFDIV
jgi:hypothetical protein